jgi:lysophospholipase L1-like esterase/sugar lactone lactonase YvrE
MKKLNSHTLLVFLFIFQFVLSGAATAADSQAVTYPDPANRFVDYVQNILDSEKENTPPRGAIVCVGSSSMRGWESDLDKDLYPLTLVKRGFGGSNFNDALYYLDDLVLAHDPRAVLVYEGDNDIGGVGVSPELALEKAETFISRIHKQLPDCRIYFISGKPSPSRWKVWPQMDKFNKMLAEKCADDKRLFFLDIGGPMLNESGEPNPAIFKQDMLHMNRAGYELWKSMIRPVLIKNELPFEKRTTVKLKKKWEASSGIETPESVYYHAPDDVLFVSNLGQGAPSDPDGDGFISKLSPNGKIIKLKWATGLDAPKGMAIQGQYLYVADVNQLVRISLDTGKIVTRFPAEGALFLNDVAADERGNVFVGDTSEDNSLIYRLEKGRLNVWLKSAEIARPNGLSMEDGDLLVGNVLDNKLHRVNVLSKEITYIADSGSRIDGLEPLGEGRYLVSNWLGRIAFIDMDGSVITVQDTAADEVNAADFEYIAEKNLLLVPTFFDNRVVAYSVEYVR